MAKLVYISRRFSPDSRAMIQQANDIIADYQRQGFRLTLRQLYYQFVSRDLLANKMTEYKRLGSVINDARLAGLIDWSAIEDRTRWLRANDFDSGDPDTWLASRYEAFSKARWEGQHYAPEVWIEKDALIGVIEGVCEELRVPYFACRGYASQSEMHEAALRMMRNMSDGKEVVIIHLGDHDPSGMDMTRDIEDRLALFCEGHAFDAPVIKRIALNTDQVQQYDPPPNPAKLTDSRAEGYIARFGDESWELDALEPSVISDLIRAEIEPLIDQDALDVQLQAEEDGQQRLKLVADNWDRVIEWLDNA